jgi:hypothetical protein
VYRVQVAERHGAAWAHRPRLQAHSLPHLRQAVQRAHGRGAEPGAISFRRHPLVVLWRLRYKLSLRDLVEMFALRGMVFSHEAVREWEAKLTPALAEELRRRRKGSCRSQLAR